MASTVARTVLWTGSLSVTFSGTRARTCRMTREPCGPWAGGGVDVVWREPDGALGGCPAGVRTGRPSGVILTTMSKVTTNGMRRMECIRCSPGPGVWGLIPEVSGPPGGVPWYTVYSVTDAPHSARPGASGPRAPT